MTSEQAAGQIERAAREGVWIDEDVARTIAAGLMSPAAIDEPLTALAHGLPFDASALLKRVHDLSVTEFAATDVLPELGALWDWTLQRVPHIEVSTVTLPSDEYHQREEFTPEDQATVVFLIEESRETLGTTYEPGDADYPRDLTGLEVDDDGSVFVTGDIAATVARMLRGLDTQFWADEYSAPGEIGGEYSDQPYDNPNDGTTTRKTARVVGLSEELEKRAHELWARS